jgi:hypothetical protein
MEGMIMDSERFDCLVQSFGQTRSRRQTLRGMAGVLATGAFVRSVPEAAAARCSNRKPCPECKKCRKHRCKPDATQDGNTCTGVSGTCERGTCCVELQADCTDAKQCCQDGGATSCAPIGNLNQDQCCRPLGGACSTPGAFEECCGVVEGGNLVLCASNNTCGGQGARCSSAATCASGVCCGIGIEAACCAAGQRCVSGQCQ